MIRKKRCECGPRWVGRHKLMCPMADPPKKKSKRRQPVSKPGCGKTDRYKAIREPRCSGGTGCWPCWAKFIINNSGWDS